MKRFWNWLTGLFIDEFMVTIYFPGEMIELPDGKKKQTYNPKEFHCKRVKIISNTEFRLFKVDGQVVHVKTVDPVGFDVTKIR